MATTIASTPIWVPVKNPVTSITVRIFCHVERLGPVYDAGWVHFSLNLSAAFDTGTNPVTPDDVRQYLKLWKWDWSQLAVLGVDDKNKTVVFASGDVTLLLDQAPPPLRSLDPALSSEMEDTISIDPTLLAFQSSSAVEGKTVDEKTRNWKGFLAHVSTFPAPLPQSLKLCVFFRVKQQAIDDAKVTEIVAAPSGFRTGGPFPNHGPQLPPTGQSWDVTDQTLPLHRVITTNTPDYYFWAYDTTTSPTVTAFLNRCPTVAPSPDSGSFMNLANMWVTKPTPLASDTTGALPLSEDWTLQLESKCADAFDFPRRLLDALQSNVQNLRDKGKLLWPVDNSFHECFLASLRDLANFGLATPPEGRTLADAVVGYLKGPVDQIKSILTAGESQNYKDVASWIKRLRDDFLPAVEPGTRFPQLPSTSHPELLPAYARALEHLYSVLAGDSLADFFLLEWDSVLKTNPFWQQQKAQIAKRLTDIQLRKRLALGNCGIAWRSFTGNLHERDALFNALKTALRSYFSERFGGSGTTNYKTYFPPVTSKLAPEIQTFLDTFAADFVDNVLLPQEPTPDDPATLTEDLTIQVDRLQRAQTGGSSDDQSDFLRRIAGLGVLLKRKGATEWRCLSLAQLNVAANPSGLDPSPVPLRLGYRNGLRQCYLTYRNQPMAASSPAADFSQTHEMIHDDDGKTPLLSYTNPYSATGPKLEGLVYRPIDSPYVAAVFLMGNAGHLPSDLAAQDQSGRKIPWSFRSTFGSVAPPFVQEIPYVRRVPVGLVRLGSAAPRGQSEMEKLALPPIPDTVLPLTRSLHVRQADAEKDREDALILLTPSGDPWLPNQNTFTFVVRPPSTTLPVWDRWVAVDSTKRATRVNVWARYHELADVPDAVSKAQRADIALDDPAVNKIRFQFTPVYPTPGSAQMVDCPVGAIAGDCSNDLNCAQSAPLQVEISSSTTLSIPTTCASPLRIGIPPGQVWKLEIFPVIQDPTRFALPSPLGKPVTLYIEIAAPLVEGTPDDLRALLNGALQLGFGNEQLQISLEPPDSNPLWHRMHRLEIMLQRWRWDGRPVCYFDWTKDKKPQIHYGLPPGALVAALEQYDGTLFGSRESSDYLSVPSRVDFAAPTATHAAHKPVYQTNLSMLPGALYFRAAVRAFSRYEGLLRSGDLRDSIESRPTSLANEAERWQRILVPCRYLKSVPRPVVKLVLPLTQATPASALSPDTLQLQPGDAAGDPTALAESVNSGLLVILDESWYSDALGGVGETFEWDIVRTALPDVPDDSRLEFGPDPILDLRDDPLAGRTVRAFPAVGAIGYTNDTGTPAPLFTRASFVLPPPTVDGLPDLSWFFLKLRFRRRLTLAPLLKADSSDWTEPVWTQLLPPSNLIQVEGQPVPLPASRLYFDPSLPGFRDGGTKGKPPVKPQPCKSGGQCSFELWLLLTRQIVDALGRRNQESFVGLAPLDKLDQLLPMPAGSVIRLIEIQRRPNIDIGDLDKLINAMFPNATDPAADPPDATARIVRIFTPMSVSNK